MVPKVATAKFGTLVFVNVSVTDIVMKDMTFAYTNACESRGGKLISIPPLRSYWIIRLSF